MKKALVCGAGGFIGGHLLKKLKKEGYWVRGVDIKEHEFAPTQTDEFLILDLIDLENCKKTLILPPQPNNPNKPNKLNKPYKPNELNKLDKPIFDEVYKLAADISEAWILSILPNARSCGTVHSST